MRVLHRHQEGLVHLALRLGDGAVQRLDQILDGLGGLGIVRRFQRLCGRTHDHRDVVAGEVVFAQEFADLHLHQLQQFRIVDQVHLVQEHHQRRHVHLARQQDVLARLGHRPVRGRDHQDRPVHLGGAGDHVLDVVGVPGAVHVGVVAIGRFVLHMGGGDGQDLRRVAPALGFRGLGDVVVRLVLRQALLLQNHRHRRRQRRLAMVDVTDRADVDVGLGA